MCVLSSLERDGKGSWCGDVDYFADQRGRAIDSLNRSIGTGTVVVNDEVSFVVSDGEGASAECSRMMSTTLESEPRREEGSDEVRVEIIGPSDVWMKAMDCCEVSEVERRALEYLSSLEATR
jgi:hypothetical protein